nr:hypothetical protein [Tanacetum cinerariifolium]
MTLIANMTLTFVSEVKRVIYKLSFRSWHEWPLMLYSGIIHEVLGVNGVKGGVVKRINKVTIFLKKPQGIEDFHQIVDFLNASHIRTLNNGEIELNAILDGQDKTITEAYVRRHLKLADADGICTLPTTEIFEQLALMGKTRTRTKRIGIRIPQSNVPLSVVDEAITKEMHDGLGMATTTASRFKAKQGSGNISKTQTKATPSGLSSLRTSSKGGLGCHVTMGNSPIQARPKRLSNLPNEPPLGEGNTSRSGEGSMQLLKLMDICTKLSGNVTALENELKSTKVVYNKALITLTKRVKKLEKKLKHKRRRAVVDSSEDEEASLDKEDSPKQGKMIEEIDEDENTNLVKSKIKMLFNQTIESIRNFVPMESEDQIADSKAGEGSSKEAKQVVKESSKKAGRRLKRKTSKAREDKDKRQKKQDDPEKLTLMDHVEVISNSEEVISVIPLAVKSPIVNWKSYCKGDIGYYEINKEDGSYKTYIFFSEMLNDFDIEDLIMLYRLFNEKYASTRPSFNDLMLWGDMKIMFEPDGDDAVWKNHHKELIEWKLYDSSRVYSLMLGEISIHMLVENKYPHPHDTLTRMLQWKLYVNYKVTKIAYELLRFIRDQLNQ